MSVARAQEEIGQAEFRSWQAYYLIEPWGCEVEDLRAAMGPYVAASIAAGKKKRYRISDFMRRQWKPKHMALEDDLFGALGLKR